MHQVPPPIHEEWIFNKSQFELCQDLASRQGLNWSFVQKTLEEQHLITIRFAESLSQISNPPHFLIPSDSSAELLWSDEKVEAYSPAAPRVRHHLWVVLKGAVSKFSEVSSDDAIHLKQISNQVRLLLKSCFGLDALTVQYNLAQPGRLAGRFTVEIIPPRLDSKETMNFYDRVECNNYFLFQGQFPSSLSPPSEFEVQEDCTFWKQRLVEPARRFSENTAADEIKPWIKTSTQMAPGTKYLLDCMAQTFQAHGISLERRPTEEILNVPDYNVETKGCPFCNPVVLAKETIYETNLVRVLYNFKPLTPGGHFLVVPIRHIAESNQMREDEARHMHEVAQRLVRIIESKTGSKNIFLYTQDGMAAAQSVGHTHMHVLLKPEVLSYIFFTLTYATRPSVSEEEMQAIRAEFSKEFQAQEKMLQ